MGYFSVPKDNSPVARLENALTNLKLFKNAVPKIDFDYLISMAEGDLEVAIEMIKDETTTT